MRLIDADALLDKQESLYMKGNVLFHGVTAYAVENAPTIAPETLPIVQELRAELKRVTEERDAAVKELEEVTKSVDDLAEFVDSEIHPSVDYGLYLALRENVDAVAMFQHESEWRGPAEESEDKAND